MIKLISLNYKKMIVILFRLYLSSNIAILMKIMEIKLLRTMAMWKAVSNITSITITLEPSENQIRKSQKISPLRTNKGTIMYRCSVHHICINWMTKPISKRKGKIFIQFSLYSQNYPLKNLKKWQHWWAIESEIAMSTPLVLVALKKNIFFPK